MEVLVLGAGPLPDDIPVSSKRFLDIPHEVGALDRGDVVQAEIEGAVCIMEGALLVLAVVGAGDPAIRAVLEIYAFHDAGSERENEGGADPLLDAQNGGVLLADA
jgi:hypothetical protein